MNQSVSLDTYDESSPLDDITRYMKSGDTIHFRPRNGKSNPDFYDYRMQRRLQGLIPGQAWNFQVRFVPIRLFSQLRRSFPLSYLKP